MVKVYPSPKQRHLVPSMLLLGSQLTFGQMYCHPKAETSCGQVLHYCTFVSGWPSWPNVPIPNGKRHLVAKCDTTSPVHQVDLWSEVPLWQRHLVAKCDTTSLWVKLTFRQMYPPIQRHLVAKCDTTSGQDDLFI